MKAMLTIVSYSRLCLVRPFGRIAMVIASALMNTLVVANVTAEEVGIETATPTPDAWHALRDPQTFTLASWDLDHFSSGQTPPVRYKTQKAAEDAVVELLRLRRVDIFVAQDIDRRNQRTLFANQQQMLAHDAYFDYVAWQQAADLTAVNAYDPLAIFSRFKVVDTQAVSPNIQQADVMINGNTLRILHCHGRTDPELLRTVLREVNKQREVAYVLVADHTVNASSLPAEVNIMPLFSGRMYYSVDRLEPIGQQTAQDVLFSDILRAVSFRWK